MRRKESCWAGGQLRRQRSEVRVGGRPSMQAAWQPFLNMPVSGSHGEWGVWGSHIASSPDPRITAASARDKQASSSDARSCQKEKPPTPMPGSHLTSLNTAQ